MITLYPVLHQNILTVLFIITWSQESIRNLLFFTQSIPYLPYARYMGRFSIYEFLLNLYLESKIYFIFPLSSFPWKRRFYLYYRRETYQGLNLDINDNGRKTNKQINITVCLFESQNCHNYLHLDHHNFKLVAHYFYPWAHTTQEKIHCCKEDKV